MNKRWNKIQSVWYIDVAKVGRYSVERMNKDQPFAAYLNGKRLLSEMISGNAEDVKKNVDKRIKTAIDIAKMK